MIQASAQADSGERLSHEKDWEEIWSHGQPMLTFDPYLPFFRDLHKLLQRHLPVSESMTCLEIGCYPGTHLWYFHNFFKYAVSGIEYVESCAKRCRDLMAGINVPAQIFQGDIFDFTPPQKWDVVFSVGLIEHFIDTNPIVQRHIDMLKDNGYLVIILPNHAGLNGKILQIINRPLWSMHNKMDYAQLLKSVESTNAVEVIEGGYYSHIGFWNTDLYAYLTKKGRIPYIIGRGMGYIIERIGGYIVPNSRFLSPNIALIARKKPSL